MKKNKVGRPPIFKTPEELQIKILKYFKKGVALRKVIIGSPNNRTTTLIPVPTITGLALYCGFADRYSFYEYEKKPEFTYTIKRARAFIEREYEEQLQTGTPTGAIFALKNFGWSDRQELEHILKPYLYLENREKSNADIDRELEGLADKILASRTRKEVSQEN